MLISLLLISTIKNVFKIIEKNREYLTRIWIKYTFWTTKDITTLALEVLISKIIFDKMK